MCACEIKFDITDNYQQFLELGRHTRCSVRNMEVSYDEDQLKEEKRTQLVDSTTYYFTGDPTHHFKTSHVYLY